ncbi:FadR/GntR family transcriptional regulator [Massilia sp. DWR3-1-1]|uniref:FadR/GntR family transcriptional regulator n=1 Tax=Massilia sp. DWR3-1-1 TaxID=2804559 RepID=UPI003CEE9121
MSKKIPAYRLAQSQIKQFIVSRRLKSGDGLPPEGVLAEDLGISRPSLREAVKSLESLGILESRHGEGIYVKAFSFDSIIENLPYSMVEDDAQVTNLLYVRTYLELGAIPSVVRNIQPENIEKLRSLAESMLSKALAHQTFFDEDRAFHAEMYRCMDNTFLLSLIDLFWRIFNNLIHYSGGLVVDPGELETTARDHMAIVEMLEKKDKAGLMWAHSKHFESISKRYPKAAEQL